jgi:uncharacterized protein YecT (DUF1311 family)
MKLHLALLGLWAVLMSSACTRAADDTHGTNTPATPCADARDQRTLTACWSNASRAEEERVDAAVKKVDGLLASRANSTARQRLQDDQRRWHDFVEGHCGLFGELLEGGSAAAMSVAVCRWQLAQARMEQLARLTDELDR